MTKQELELGLTKKQLKEFAKFNFEAGKQETLKQVEEMFDKCIFKLNVSGEVWVKICELKSQISKLKLNSQQDSVNQHISRLGGFT